MKRMTSVALVAVLLAAATESQASANGETGATPTAPQTTEGRPDRSFHPDYSRALSVGQIEAAWQLEIERLFPPVMAGGG